MKKKTRKPEEFSPAYVRKMGRLVRKSLHICAEECRGDMILDKSWVEAIFINIANRLEEIEEMLDHLKSKG
jgi:hypothetical protein